MQGRHQTGDDDGADNTGVEGFDPGNHRQAAACRGFNGKVDAEEVAPGHPHGVNKVVPGEKTHQHRQTGPALGLFRQTDRQTDGENQRHITKDGPAALFNDVNDLGKQAVGCGQRFADEHRVAQHDGDTDHDPGKRKQQNRGKHGAAKALYLTEHLKILM